MSHASKNSAIEIEAETLFGEATATFATLRLPLLSPVDASGLKKPKIDSARVTQTQQGGTKFIDGPFQVSFKTKHHWTGHGTSTAGATSANAWETFLGNVIGTAPSVALATGTTFAGAGTAAAPTTTAANGAVAGSILFGGALADARGGGQAIVVGLHTSSVLTPLSALPALPNNGDVLRSAIMLCPPEAPTSTTITSYRMRFLTANIRYEVRGCVPVGIQFGGHNPGEAPFVEIAWEGASFVEVTGGTFPSTVATHTALPAVISGGSVVLAAIGTTTRTTYSVRNFQVDYQMSTELFRGPGGLTEGQTLIGARRKGATIKVSFTVDADAVTATPALKALFASATGLHLLWTGSTADGSSIAIYMPNVEACGDYPVQVIDGTTNRMRFEGMAYTGLTTTSELTQSAIRFALG